MGRDPSGASHTSVPPLTGAVLACFTHQGWSLVAGSSLLALQVRSTGWDCFRWVLALVSSAPRAPLLLGREGAGEGDPTAPVGRPGPSRELCASLVASSRESVQTQSGSSIGRDGPRGARERSGPCSGMAERKETEVGPCL